MINITNLLKKEYEGIKPSKEMEERILNQTIYKTKKYTFKKIVTGLSSALTVCLLSLGVVYADDIREYLKTWKIKYDFNNASSTLLSSDNYEYKTLKDDTLKTKENGIKLDYEQVEKALGFKLLKSTSQINKEINYTTYLNKDKKTIASVYLTLPDLYTKNNENLSFQASFITDKADEDIKKLTLEDETGIIKNYIDQKKSEIGSEVLLYTVERLAKDSSFNDKEVKTVNCLNADFVYDGVKYSIMSFNKMSVDEMINIINSLSL